MNRHELHPVTQIVLFLAAVIGGTAIACVSGLDSPRRVLIWIVAATVILLRLVGVNWGWSILAGVLIVFIYTTWNAFMTSLLFA